MDSKAYNFSPWNDYLEENICKWGFDMLKFKELTKGTHMLEFGCSIFKRFKILKTLGCSTETMSSFLTSVGDGYKRNPYHNSVHGADVANGCGYILENNNFKDHYNELEISCVIISALVHDLGHPGVNNAFLVASNSQEAIIYNDQSVLENFHASAFFNILKKSDCNILNNLQDKDYRFFRKLSINLILDTDLTKHFVLVTQFKNSMDSLNMKEDGHKHLSLSMCLKCADVAHGAKPLALHKKWSRRVLEEFFL